MSNYDLDAMPVEKQLSYLNERIIKLEDENSELKFRLKTNEKKFNDEEIRLKNLLHKLEYEVNSYSKLVVAKETLLIKLEKEILLIQNRRLIRYGDKFLKIPKKLVKLIKGKR